MARGLLVLDSNLAVLAAARRMTLPASYRYVAPPLLWSEAPSALREGQWRREVSRDVAVAARTALLALPVERDDPDDLRDVAWAVADELGLAKTYDAEFLALARIRCRLVTAGARLRRAGDRLGFVVDPVEAFGP